MFIILSHSVCTNISNVFNDCYMTIYVYNCIFIYMAYMALIFRWSQLFQPYPAAGTFEMAAKPLGTSANFKPADGDK